jgi:hypothetical protein
MLNPETSDLSPPVRPAAPIAASAEACPFLNPAQHDAREGDDRRFPAQLAETFVPQHDNASRLRAHARCPLIGREQASVRTRRSSLTRQIDLICAPRLMSIGATLAAQISIGRILARVRTTS